MSKDDPCYDPWCDPDNPRKIRYDDVLAATRRLVGNVVRTPCVKSRMSEQLGCELYLKAEFLQVTGSFKERGITNTLLLLSDEQKKYGVISATTGNHGLALAYQATKMKVPCVIVMAMCVSLNKAMKCEKYGVKVILYGENLDEARRHAIAIAKEKKMLYVNGYDHPNICEGQGTAGIEILEQINEVDAVLVPVGGGSLLAGCAVALKHLKPNIEVYGIESDKTNSMTESLRKGERVFLPQGPALCNAMAVNLVGVNTFNTIKGLIDKMVVVTEDWVARAILRLAEDDRYIIEGAGAAGVACLMAGLFPHLKGKKVVVIASGGNIEPIALMRALQHGMVLEGRLVEFKIKTSDKKGSLAEVINLLASVNAVIRDLDHEHTWVKGDVFSVEFKILVETRGWDQAKEVASVIKKNYPDSVFTEQSPGDKQGGTARRGPCLAPNPVCMQK